MSMMIRSLLRDPLARRPVSRALARRWDDDPFFSDWSPRKAARLHPAYTMSPVEIFDEMNRQMADTINRMNEFVEDIGELDSLFSAENSKLSRHKSSIGEAVVRRTESGGLQLALDVGDFKPSNLKIKLVGDNLVVEGLSEQSGEDSFRKNQFKRWFKLPEDCKLEDIKSKLTGDNRLLIDLPSNKPIEQEKSREIPIEMSKEQLDTKPEIESKSGSSTKS